LRFVDASELMKMLSMFIIDFAQKGQYILALEDYIKVGTLISSSLDSTQSGTPAK